MLDCSPLLNYHCRCSFVEYGCIKPYIVSFVDEKEELDPHPVGTELNFSLKILVKFETDTWRIKCSTVTYSYLILIQFFVCE